MDVVLNATEDVLSILQILSAVHCAFLFQSPTVGALNAESLKGTFYFFLKSDLVTKQLFFFLRITTIFCMRKTVIISNGSRILPCPLGLQNDQKTKIYFWAFFESYFFVLFESLWGYRYVVPPWGHFSSSSSFLFPYVFTLGFASQFGQFA